MGCFLACFGLSKKRKRSKRLYKVIAADQILDNEEEESDNSNGETEGSAALIMTYPSNYRYYNHREGCDEEDEIAYEESDINAYDDNNYVFDDEEIIKNQLPLAPNDAEMKSNLCGQNRSMCMHSVMSPVENLTQWKAIKAKVTSSNKHRRKENVPPEKRKSKTLVSETSLNFSPFRSESNIHHSKPLLPEIAINASFQTGWFLQTIMLYDYIVNDVSMAWIQVLENIDSIDLIGQILVGEESHGRVQYNINTLSMETNYRRG
ncbi:hypothetical protein CR513_42843, partial [Mucuna pruriens]